MSSPNIGSSDLSSLSSPIAAANADSTKDYRKRQLPPSAPSYSPNETLNQMTQEAEARQQDKLNAQKEIRAIRAAEIERKRNEDEERDRRGGGDRSFRSDSITTMNSSLTKPRQNSTRSDNYGDESNPNDPKELQKKLKEMDEKFKKHAMYQTQLENDNQKLIYEVELLKDMIEENEELITELRRQFKEKARELDFERRAKKDLQTDFNRLKEILKQRDALIENSGLILYTDNEVKKKVQQANNTSTSSSNNNTPVMKDNDTPVKSTSTPNTAAAASKTVSPISALQSNAVVASLSSQLEELNNEIRSVLPAALVSPATAKLLDTLGEGTIDDKLRQLLSEKQELKETTTRLLSEVEKERHRSSQLERRLLENTSKMIDSQDASHDLHELQRQYTKEINDLKMKLQKIEHENIIIKQDKQRLDTQLKYLQTNMEDLEQTERRLMKEKREAQRELNESKMQISDLTLKLEVYQKTLEKKRQPTATKFLDAAAASSYTSLTSQSLASTTTLSNTTTPLGTLTTALSSSSSATNPLLTSSSHNHHLNSLSSSSSMSSIANSNDPTQDVVFTIGDSGGHGHRKNSTSINLLEIKSNNHNNNSEIGNKTISSGSGGQVVIQHESSPPPTISSHEASSNSSSSSASPSNHRSSNDDAPPPLSTSSSSSNSKEIKIIRINGNSNKGEKSPGGGGGGGGSTNGGSTNLLMDASSRGVSNA